MTMPADVIQVPIIGTWLDGNGLPCNSVRSFVVFSPKIPTRWSDIASNTAIMPQRKQVYLDTNGSISTTLIATDCAALAGIAGMVWNVGVLLWDNPGLQQLTPYSFTMTAPSGTVGSINISAPQYAVNGTSVGIPAM